MRRAASPDFLPRSASVGFIVVSGCSEFRYSGILWTSSGFCSFAVLKHLSGSGLVDKSGRSVPSGPKRFQPAFHNPVLYQHAFVNPLERIFAWVEPIWPSFSSHRWLSKLAATSTWARGANRSRRPGDCRSKLLEGRRRLQDLRKQQTTRLKSSTGAAVLRTSITVEKEVPSADKV